MIAANRPGRPARIFAVDGLWSRSLPAEGFASLFEAGEVLVLNDAATLPASLGGIHERTGARIELRLAARRSLDVRQVERWDAVLFGDGDHHTVTESRPLPPAVSEGDRLILGALTARVEAVLGHPRMLRVRFLEAREVIWEALARQGRPIQYAHVPEALALWDVWTKIAGPPVALEPPSAGFVLDWTVLALLRERGVEIVSLTHAAGLSSTGDRELDARLPLPEPYAIPASTALAVRRARRRGSRVIALGTTVARALESAARAGNDGGVRAGRGLATLRLGPETELRAVDVIVSGVHEPGTSHYELLKAFLPDEVLASVTETLEREGYRHHEFGDAVWIASSPRALCSRSPASTGSAAA